MKAYGLRLFVVLAMTLGAPGSAFAQCSPQWRLLADLDDLAHSLIVLPNGDLVAGGEFSTLAGLPIYGAARWHEHQWSPMNTALGGIVIDLAVTSTGELLTGGYSPVPNQYLGWAKRWNGASWSMLGSGMGSTTIEDFGYVFVIAPMGNGDVIAGGSFGNSGGVPANNIARWNGSGWSAMGTGMTGWVTALAAMPNGDVVAGGMFTSAGGVPATGIARWDGASWSSLGGGVNGSVYSLQLLPGGDLLVGGTFTAAGGVPANDIARWNGSTWSALGTGITGGSNSGVSATAILPNGDLVAGGTFSTAGGNAVNNVARWDGASWLGLTTGVDGHAVALAVLPNGDLVVSQYSGGSGPNFTANIFVYSTNPTCFANCDCSGAAPILNANDFQCYINKFAAGDPYANCDGSTAPPLLTANDFQCFLNKFAAGCSGG